MGSPLTEFGLDRFLVLSHSSSVPIEQFTSKFKLFIFFLANLSGGKEYLVYILSKDYAKNREFRMMLDKFGSRETGPFITMAATSKQFPSISLVRGFHDINSAVLVSGFLDQGKHILLWAYNHSQQDEMSRVIEEAFAKEPYFELLYLGPESFENLLSDKIKENRTLYRVKIEAVNPYFDGKRTELSMVPKVFTKGEKTTAVCRLRTPIEDQKIIPQNALSLGDDLYQAPVDLPIFNRFSNYLIGTPVYVSRFDARVRDRVVDICFNVTHLGKNALLSLISTVAKEMPESEVHLTEVRQI
jgi:hypothetical protein